MSKNFSRVLWALAGILLVIAGVTCLAQPAVALVTMSVFLGVSMLVSGIIDLVIYARGHAVLFGAGFFLVDGILTVVLSLLILFNQAFTTLTLPMIFGMWLLFSGISNTVHSFDLRRLGVHGWGWFTALGILLAVAGFCSFMDPVIGMVTLDILVGGLLILQGVASILRAFFSGRFLM